MLIRTSATVWVQPKRQSSKGPHSTIWGTEMMLRRGRERPQDQCKAPRCPTPHPPSQIMCTKHMKLVPYQIKKILYANLPKPGMPRSAELLYLTAVADAIESVRLAEEERRS